MYESQIMLLNPQKTLKPTNAFKNMHDIHEKIQNILPFANMNPRSDVYAMWYLRFLRSYVMIPEEIKFITQNMQAQSLEELYRRGHSHEAIVYCIAQLSFARKRVSSGSVFMVQKLEFVRKFMLERIRKQRFDTRRKTQNASHYYQNPPGHDKTTFLCLQETRQNVYDAPKDYNNHITSLRFFTNVNTENYEAFVYKYIFTQAEMNCLVQTQDTAFNKYINRVISMKKLFADTKKTFSTDEHDDWDVFFDVLKQKNPAAYAELVTLKKPVLHMLSGHFPDDFCATLCKFLEQEQITSHPNIYQEAFFLDIITEIEQGEKQFKLELERGGPLLSSDSFT